jgi:acetylornithine deacetylase/succinyl-diaminopimelate desuccinylase-like protein
VWAEAEPVPPIKLPMENTAVERATQAITTATEKSPLMKYCGGTLPIAYHFAHILNIDQVYVPLANEDCAMHGVNENITERCVKEGLEINRRYLQQS